jgi:hypothetical protein
MASRITKTQSYQLPVLALLLGLLAACSSEEVVSTAGGSLSSATTPAISLDTLSSRPWLVTGGDVLVEVALEDGVNPAQVSVTLNGADISAEFLQVSSQRLQAMLSGLPEGDSTLQAVVTGENEQDQLILTNYPISGPIISGPHESPYYCQTEEFILVTGEMLGRQTDADCSVMTRVDYVYWSGSEERFKPLQQLPGADPIQDMGEIVNFLGETVPYIVRVETGTVNRAVYEIAMLHDPDSGEPDPWNRSPNWNGKLVYTHGGGCRGGWYQQGDHTGGVMREGLFGLGYAVTSATLNVFGQNCNDLLASETHIMVKERFIEHYGVPIYTIATGSSGGSYQSHQTADNYPGVFDGIIVASSFPDVTSATIFTLADARLLNNYFTLINNEGFNREQQQAIAGFGSWGSIANLARGAARLDPIYDFDATLEEQGGEVNIPALEMQRYRPTMINGVRATVYDHTVNVYGLVEGTPIAQRPLDNVGVQYGLAALNAGSITAQQFIDLNRDIGGFDQDLNHVPERHRADAQASRRAIESGRILYGGAGLASTPIIDYRNYTDHAEDGDIHMIVHQFSTRQRLVNANGHADNHVMQVGGRWGFSAEEPDLGDLFRQMDSWLMAVLDDNSDLGQAEKVRFNKPATLQDACWDNSRDSRVKLEQLQTYTGDSECNRLYPAYSTPRHVAGAPLANDVVSCQLRELSAVEYGVSFTDEQWSELNSVFAEGVCDWSRTDSSRATHQGVWKSFGPSPVNRLYH